MRCGVVLAITGAQGCFTKAPNLSWRSMSSFVCVWMCIHTYAYIFGIVYMCTENCMFIQWASYVLENASRSVVETCVIVCVCVCICTHVCFTVCICNNLSMHSEDYECIHVHITNRHGGNIPNTVEGLKAIPGIGDYTAGAVASIAFNVQVKVNVNIGFCISCMCFSVQCVEELQVIPGIGDYTAGAAAPIAFNVQLNVNVNIEFHISCLCVSGAAVSFNLQAQVRVNIELCISYVFLGGSSHRLNVAGILGNVYTCFSVYWNTASGGKV